MRAKFALPKGLAIALGTACLFFAAVLQAQTVTELHVFTGAPDGAYPSALVQGRDGNLYGATGGGGVSANTCSSLGYNAGCGTVFKMDALGNVTLLHSFDGTDGFGPAGVILASDGYYYGVTGAGGANNLGTLFRISAGGIFTKLHDFANTADGEFPQQQLLQASDGNLYGFTETGLYRATTSGTVTTLYTFSPYPVTYITAPLIQASNGSLYATLPLGYYDGHTYPCGAIVRFTLDGAIISEHDFGCNTDQPSGYEPFSAPTQALDGNFYATCTQAGSSGEGTAFKLDARTGILTVLHNYTVTSEYPFAGLAQGTDGNFYGVVEYSNVAYSGTVDQVTPDGVYTELVGLPYHGEDSPYSQLLQHTNGTFYSSVEYAENQPGYYGSVYSFDNGLGPFITFVRARARIGGTAQILGQGLTGASGVSFNGVPATSFSVVSDMFMTAIVPTGATSGQVVVTIPTGSLTSNRNFQIGH